MQEALCEAPQVTLSFYSYGILMRKQTESGYVEYAVDASQVAQALAAKIVLDTGILSEDTLLIQREGVREVVVSFRKAQKSGIWLERSSEPLRIPLPPLVLIRVSNGNSSNYSLFAVKKRPNSLDEPLFNAPLPNIYSSGSICWGNVRLNTPKTANLAEDWRLLLGSAFGNHSLNGKSIRYPSDIRQHLLALQDKRIYPKRDLVATKKTLGQVLEKGTTYA